MIVLAIRMRSLASVVFVLVVYHLCFQSSILQAQPGLACLRTGAEIDSSKRLYFGLFPDVSGFKKALLESDAALGRGISIRIATVSGEQIVSLSPEDAALFREYIDRYEQICFGCRTRSNVSDANARFQSLEERGIIDEFELYEPLIVELDGISEGDEFYHIRGALVYAGTGYLFTYDPDSVFNVRGQTLRATDVGFIHYLKVESSGSFWPAYFQTLIASSVAALAVGVTGSQMDDTSEAFPYLAAGLGIVGSAITLSPLVGWLASVLESRKEYALWVSSREYEEFLESYKEREFFKNGFPPEIPPPPKSGVQL